MELRVLRYFLTVAKEQSFTKAAISLHITQPTLSRQLAALEEELGTTLFNRVGHSITLTDEGLLLKRRALEIIDLEDKIVEEFNGNGQAVEGVITVGCGEFTAIETLAEIIKNYKKKYPMVQIAIHTGTADTILEMMNKGLIDIGLFLEPVSTEGLDYIRIKDSDTWVVGMKPDDTLASKEFITKEDLLNLPLILPERLNVQSAGVMAARGLGYLVSIAGAAKYWREDLIVQRKLYPEIKSSTVIAWRRHIPYSKAINLFIEEINAYKA